eukprot:TRINITY_DN70681_c0_g1_i1.p2 TRINITY_DN70681_c0_g1~~TRINITY_DN70681_c0_g1_i1.p2  ORF type:complete len:576 (-),score=54.05 TRINITY_DN70681_c0_g1_i1:278-2005(-)
MSRSSPVSESLTHRCTLWVVPPLPFLSRPRAQFSGAPVPIASKPQLRLFAPLMVANIPQGESSSPVTSTPTHNDTLIHQETLPLSAFETFEQVIIPQSVSVSGTLPYYLHDLTMYSVGPGVFEATHSDGTIWKAEHPLEGIGMTSSFRFNVFNNSVTVRSRINSPRLLDAIQRTPASQFRMFRMIEIRKPLWQTLLEWRPFAIDFELMLPYTNYVVLAEYIPGKGLCTRTDYPCAQVIDPVTLAPSRQFRFSEFHPKLAGTMSTAHGMYDEDTGEYLNIVWNMLPGKTDYHVFSTNGSGHTNILATFRERSYYMHSACMTKNYFIVVLSPLTLSLWDVVLSGRVGNSMKVVEGEPVKFIVVSRKNGGVVRTYTHQYFTAMHSVNSYESGNDIVLDLCSTESVTDVFGDTEKLLRDKCVFQNASITRFVLPSVDASNGTDLSPCHATSEVVFEETGDFPVISPRFALKEHRYVYLTMNSEGVQSGRVQKIDMKTGQVKKFGLRNCVLGEMAFVPDPNGEAEDDGCLVFQALDTVTRKSTVLVLDASKFEEIARAQLEFAVPNGVHTYIRSSTTSFQ